MKKAKKVKRQPYYCEVRGSWIIPLTQGRETLVDAEDVEFLGQFNWRLLPARNKIGYAIESNTAAILMHRITIGCPDGFMVDHVNGNSLDNRKKNLRICTNRENQCNQQRHRDGKLYGAFYQKRDKKWRSYITLDNVKRHLGFFNTELEAHQAYLKAYNELVKKKKSVA